MQRFLFPNGLRTRRTVILAFRISECRRRTRRRYGGYWQRLREPSRVGRCSIDPYPSGNRASNRCSIDRRRPCRRARPIAIVPCRDRHSEDPKPRRSGNLGPRHRLHCQISMVPGICSGRTTRRQQLHRLESVKMVELPSGRKTVARVRFSSCRTFSLSSRECHYVISYVISGQAVTTYCFESQLDIGEALELHLKPQIIFHPGVLLGLPGGFCFTPKPLNLTSQRSTVAAAIPFGHRGTPIAPTRITIRLRLRDPFEEEVWMLPFGCFRHLRECPLRYSVFRPSLSATCFRSASIVRMSLP